MRKPTPPPSGRSKVKVLYIDADLAPGDLQELTQSITAAVRPTHVISRVAPPARLATPANGQHQDDGNGELEEIEAQELQQTEDEEQETEAPAPAQGPSRKRKYRTPKVVDIDMKAGGKPFEEFAKEKGNPSDHVKRYLVAAAWLNEYAKISSITIDHVYTCYRSVGWTFDVTDPVFPFRRLKKDAGTYKNAVFTIGHLGLAQVEKMKVSATGV